MAKKAKRGPGRPKKEVPVAPSELTRVISEGAFKTLIRAITAAEADKNESVGRIGSLVSQAVEKHNLNKWALGAFRRIKRMSPAKANDALSQLDHMLEISGLNAVLAQQPEMFEAEETGAVDEPAPDSFAAKVRANNLADAENDAEPPRRPGRPRKAPLTEDEVQAAADRAEAAGTTH